MDDPIESIEPTTQSTAEPESDWIHSDDWIESCEPVELPRIWSAIAVPLIAIIVGLIVAGIAIVVVLISAGTSATDSSNLETAMADLLSHPMGIWVAVIPGQLVFLGAAVIAASLSPVPMRQRLRLGRGRMSAGHAFAFAVATPMVGIITWLLFEFAGAKVSEHLEQLTQLMTANSAFRFIAVAVLVGVVPGFVEEILFRGYLQSRLLKRWSPIAAIGVSSVIFAIAHVDPLHAAIVFPVGVWLGIVAWRADCIWPAMLGHMVNNLAGVVAVQWPADDSGLSFCGLSVDHSQWSCDVMQPLPVVQQNDRNRLKPCMRSFTESELFTATFPQLHGRAGES